MKKVIIILVFVSLCSCWRESGTFVTYFYENKSGANVKIIDMHQKKEIVSIADNFTYEWGNGACCGHFPFPFHDAGKIAVIFNSDRLIQYSYDMKVENNPLSLDSYRVVTIKKKKHESEYAYYYTFTEKQYQDAEPYVPEK